MFKKLLVLGVSLIMAFSLVGCKFINRVTVKHENLEELQAVLPELYYFDFNYLLETNDPDIDLVFESIIEPVEFSSYAILSQDVSEKNYEHFGYRIVCNLEKGEDLVVLSITGYKHNNRDFIVNSARIDSEYQNARQKEDFIEERTIDGIRCVAYGETTVFFWTNDQQYTITIHQATNQNSFTINSFFSFVELLVNSRNNNKN